MSNSTFSAVVRTKGGREDASAGVVPVMLKCYADPTAAAATAMTVADGSAAVLPKGAVPLSVSSLGGATGGAAPTVDVGDGSDDDGFANELDADGVSLRQTGGALIGVALAADTPLYAMNGASAATGGTTVVVMEYLPADAAEG